MEKPQPILSHMPRHIKEKIVNSLQTIDKLSLRQCSKEFKSAVDQSPIVYDSLNLLWDCWETAMRVERVIRCVVPLGESEMYNNRQKLINHLSKVEFQHRPNGFVKKNLRDNSEVFVENGDFAGAVVEQFVKAFRNPNVIIQELTIFLDDSETESYNGALIMDKIEEFLRELGHRVAVRKLVIELADTNAQNFLRVLPYLQPGTLEDLGFGFLSFQPPFPVVNWNELIGMEHWKQAKRLTIGRFSSTFGREATAHFAEAAYHVETFDIEDLKYIIANFLKEDGWTTRTIYCQNFHLRAIREYLSQRQHGNCWRLGDNFKLRSDGVECDITIERRERRVRILFHNRNKSHSQ